MLKELEYPAFTAAGAPRVSWGAVIAGAITSLAVLLALTSLGAGVGLIAAQAGGAVRLGLGGAAWTLLSGIAAFYAGGWVAGRLTGIPRVSESVLHGFIAWGAATVTMAFVFTTAAVGAFGAAAGVRSAALSAVGSATLEQARAAGAAGLFAFVMLVCNAAASCWGARNGARVLKPVPVPESPKRERIGL